MLSIIFLLLIKKLIKNAVSSKEYKLWWMSCIYFYFLLYVCCLETYLID